MLFNDACYANIHHTGIGCFDYQLEGKEGIQLFTGVGRICDYDVFGKEHLYSRLVYIRDNETGSFWTLNWEPICKPTQKFSCTHSMGYTMIANQTENIAATLTITIPPGNDAVELWMLTLEDIEGRQRDLSVFSYFQLQFKYKWGFDSYGDMIYRTTAFDPDNNMFYANKHPYVTPHDYLTAFFTSDYPVSRYDGSRRLFMGQYGTASNPDSVRNGQCTNSSGSAEDTVCVLQWDVLLEGARQDISFMFGVSNSRGNCLNLRKNYLHNVMEWRDKAESNRRDSLKRVHIETQDTHLNRMMNVWTKLACLYSSTWCRWGYNGYRDIVQHGLGVVNIMPERTKRILLEALRYQYSHGMAVRGWNPIDDRPYSDSALWTVYTLAAYIKETGDRQFPYVQIPFLDGGEDTLLGHVIRALDFLENNKGEHGLLLIKFGDWNDSLTGAGKDGRGESVWLSMAYAYALSELAGLCRFLDEDELGVRLTMQEATIREALMANAWEGDRFVRCFDDNGRPIGSKECQYGKIFLETQSFSMIIGLGTPEQQNRLRQTLHEELDTPLGYLLLSPAYREFDDRVGRLSAMEPGIAENGTVYTHPNLWMAYGLIRNGFAEEAYQLIRKVTPGFMNQDNEQLKQNSLPYQYANGYFGPEHKNNAYQMEFSWITGSVAWARLVVEEWMLGIRADYQGLTICPCLPDAFGSYTVFREYRGCRYHITVIPGASTQGAMQIYVDNQPIEGCILPVFTDQHVHEVHVQI